MAEDLASRVADTPALRPELRERVERAAARFGSIHERWSSSELSEPTPVRSEENAGGAVTEGTSRADDDGLPLAREAVSVTPILGIDTDESDEAGRPRFKTLMGVPRSSPELDELAGLDSSSGRHDTVPIERSALRSPAAAASAERASSRVDEAPSLAGTSLPWEPGAAPVSSTGGSPAPWPSLAHSSFPAELAALRTNSRRRSWWIGLGTVAAAAALFAVAAPRQRTLAWRWLESEYSARMRPAAAAVSDTARALRPSSSAATAPPSAIGTAQLEAPLTVPARALREQTAAPEDSSESAASARPAQEDARDPAGIGTASREPAESSDAAAVPASSGTVSSVPKRKQAARDARSGGGTTTKSRAHVGVRGVPAEKVAAPRKPSQNEDNRQTSMATKVAVTSGSSATKARATRQNTPRKDSGGGIIRETPF